MSMTHFLVTPQISGSAKEKEMSERFAKGAIKRVAKREGKSESEIRKELEKVILIEFLNKETRHKRNTLFRLERLRSYGG